MSREAVSIRVPDLSMFARSLARELAERRALKADPPGHVETLNLLAARWATAMCRRCVRVCVRLRRRSQMSWDDSPAVALTDNARKALRQFDKQGRLIRWPTKLTVQRMAMWVLWTRFEAKRIYTEREVNAILKDANGFSDHATLRRELINHRLLARKSDCSEYWKLPARRKTKPVRCWPHGVLAFAAKLIDLDPDHAHDHAHDHGRDHTSRGTRSRGMSKRRNAAAESVQLHELEQRLEPRLRP